MDDVAAWLQGLGLEQYCQAFADNAIDGDVLFDLTDEDLASLGVLLGHRKKILRAILSLRANNQTSLTEISPPAPVDQREAENRLLTVMFCDLVGSTELSSQLDPEDLRELLRDYQRACTNVVAAYDGFVAQYLGDGIMVYFGYPRAQEDAAERAIHAALDIVEAVRGLNEAKPLRVRIGITTGTALVGDVIGQGSLAQIHAASGQTPILAARIHALAEPQQVLIGDPTRRRVGGLFDYQDLGDVVLKGIPDPVRIWRVLSDRKGASRFEAVRSAVLAPLVGRRDESNSLERLWQMAKSGQGRVALVQGEAGIGKSRMIEAMRQSLEAEDHRELRWQCSPRHLNSPLYPFIEQLHLAADLAGAQGDDDRWTRLMGLLTRTGQHDTLDLPLLAQLLSISTAAIPGLVGLAPARQRALTIEALVRYLAGSLRGKAGLLIFEDAQWVDPSSLEVLQRCVKELKDWPALMIVTARPEFSPPWTEEDGVVTVQPSRIEPADAKSLIAGVTGYRVLPTEVEDTIIRKADGNPLFIEELTKLVLESGLLREEEGEFILTGSMQSLSVPETLQDSLMERLDRWPALKEVAQIGAVIGGEFSFRMISAVSDISERILQGSLQQLASSEIIRSRGQMPELDYVFKHALLQDAAYSSLMRSKRQKLHRRVADTLKNLFPEIVRAAPQVMAHHLSEAGAWADAISFYHQAGQRAMQRSANLEAVRHLADGIAMLARLPEGTERLGWEFNLNLSLGQACFVTDGPAARSTTEAFSIAQRLVEQVGDPAQRYDVLYGIFGGYMLSCRLDLALEPAEHVLDIANRAGDNGFSSLAHRMLGALQVHKGNLEAGRQHLQNALYLYDNDYRELAFRYGSDIRIAAKLYLAGIDCLTGARDQAVSTAAAALREARDLGHAQTIGQAFAYNVFARYYYDEFGEAEMLADDGLDFCEKTKVSTFAFIFRMFKAWAQSRRKDPEECAGRIRQMIAAYADTGATIGLPLYRSLLAETLISAGRPEEGVVEMDLALEHIAQFGEHFFEPMAWHMRGLCLSACDRSAGSQVEESWRQAVTSATRIGARLYAVKALCGLVERRPDRALLAELREQMRGFDSGENPPLRRAAQLLRDHPIIEEGHIDHGQSCEQPTV